MSDSLILQKTIHKGFTIVELLIVVVVIAILASVSIVVYAGIQERAENTKTISGVNQAVKLLANYKTLNSDYPTTPEGWACIGTGYENNVCVTAANGVAVVGLNQEAFNEALRSVGSLPHLSTKNITRSDGPIVAGASWEYGSRMLRYHLSGSNAQCGAGGSRWGYGPVIQCRIILE